MKEDITAMSNFRKLNFEGLVRELERNRYKQLHIHHTWKPTHRNFNGSNYIPIQQGMKNYHVNTNKWADIAQHLTLFPDGVWLTGRPFNVTPVSISGWNTGALAVEMIGNFDLPNTNPFNVLGYDKLEGRQKEEILKLIRYFIDKYGENSVKFHRDNASKSCPGTSLDKAQMIREAKALGNKPEQPKVTVDIFGRKVELNGYLKDGTNYIEIDTGNGKKEFLPIRTIAESLGIKVGWDGVNRIVTFR